MEEEKVQRESLHHKLLGNEGLHPPADSNGEPAILLDRSDGGCVFACIRYRCSIRFSS